jgi:hypothetical protein
MLYRYFNVVGKDASKAYTYIITVLGAFKYTKLLRFGMLGQNNKTL